MNYFINYFKTNVIDGTFEMAKRIFRPVALTYVVYFLVATLVSTWFTVTILQFDLTALQELSTFPEMIEFYEDYAATFVPDAKFYMSLIIILIAILLTSAWFYQLGIRIADRTVQEQPVELGEMVKSSFNARVLGLIAIALIVMVSYLIVAMIGSSLVMALRMPLMALLVFFGVFLVILKFTIAPAAYVIGDLTIREAIRYSWQHITFFRALKLFGFGILLAFIFMIVFFLVSMLTMVFQAIPYLGQIVGYAVNIAFGGYLSAVMIGAMVGLYYRYLDLPSEPEVIEESY